MSRVMSNLTGCQTIYSSFNDCLSIEKLFTGNAFDEITSIDKMNIITDICELSDEGEIICCLEKRFEKNSIYVSVKL